MWAALLALRFAAAASAPPSPPPAGAPPATATSAPAPLPEVPPGENHVDWLALPIISYDADAKLGYGAAANIQWTGKYEPYRYQLTSQILFTTGGRQSHYVRYDAPRFLGTHLRLWARLEYHREKYAPYYGIGNGASASLLDHPGLSGDHPFAYRRTQPIGRLGLSIPLGDRFWLFSLLTYQSIGVELYPGSLLALDRPPGVEGERELLLNTGAYYDARDHEAVPTRGYLLELSARGVKEGLGSSATYAGLSARYLQFASPHPRTVFAFRLQGDWLTAGAPFYALRTFGGIDSIEGIGGGYSARGIPQDRYVGRLKFLGTAEVRWRLFERPVLGEPLAFGGVGFLDLGRVWQLDGTDGGGLGIHPGYGVGVRLWRRAFVLRADLASSPDRPFGAYLLFGHFF